MRRLVFCGLLVAPLLLAAHAAGQAPARRVASSDVGAARRYAGHYSGHHHHGNYGRGHSAFWFDLSFPWYAGGGYAPAFGGYFPSYSYFGYSVVVPPPTVINVISVNPAAVQGAPAVPAANKPAAPADPVPDPAPKPKVRATNAEHKARAGRFLGFGNANFAAQRYLTALARYKTAIDIAPDIAESYFREGVAHVALGQYESAARAFRRGLRIQAVWNAPPFLLDDLYDNAPLPKTQHLEELARAVEANSFDADLLLVLGMQLFFDGQAERARVFFTRSAQLGGNEDRLLDGFLDEQKPDAAAGAQQQGGKITF